MLRDTHHGEPCAYCPRIMDRGSVKLQPTRDHVIPRSRNGTVKVICCAQCNTIKADMMPGEWNAYMLANPGWWLLTAAERRARARSSRRQYDFPNKKGNRTMRAAPRKPVIVPKELIYGHREEGRSDGVTAVVVSPAKVETSVLEERAARRQA